MKEAMSLSLLLGFVVAVGLVSTCGGEPMADKEVLLGFLRRVPHGRLINWSRNTSACFWEGVVCDVQKQRILELRLPGVGLYGEIPSGTLGQLTELRVLSLRSNLLSGALPSDLGNARFLRSLYLQHNAFSGPLPASLSYWSRLTRLDLSYNNFSGAIPFSLNNLTHLTGLYLQNNSLTGTIPSIDLRKLVSLDLSNNRLNGSIPRPLARFNSTSFRGNAGLCGKPLADCRPFFMAPSPSPIGNASPRHKKEKLSKGIIVAIVVGSVALLFLLAVCLILLCARRRRADRPVDKGAAKGATSVEKGGSSSAKDEYPTSSSQEAERNKLVFFQGSQYTFDLEDLLRASAEVLGKGSVGTSYKAVLEDGTTVVVKRLKDVVAARKDFEQQMELVGRIRHANLVPLRAFYFSKDEKLLVYDYMPAGSLSALLHGSRGSGRTPLDWETRMKIAVSTARGVAHIHEEGGGKFTHGNIKSSNILLSTDMDSRVSDFGLVPLFSAAAAANRIAGYRAPEVVETRKVTQKSDVYSFGVLVLELLTGKSPTQASLNEEGVDLPRWVQSVVREEWTAEVFDVELMRYNNIEEEMVQLLQIAMACVAAVPDQRPKMQDVVRMIQDMRPIDTTTDDNNNNATRHSSSKESTTQTPEAHTPSAPTP